MMLFVVSKNGTKGRKVVLVLSLLLVALFVAVHGPYSNGVETNDQSQAQADPKGSSNRRRLRDGDHQDHLRHGAWISYMPACKQQQEFIKKHFEDLGAKVTMQEFPAKHPKKGPVTLANMIVEFHPEATERILICCHYDTRPFPSEDPDVRKRETEGIFIGANDGGSGVALLCEMGRVIPKIKCIVHAEATRHLHRTLGHIRSLGARAGGRAQPRHAGVGGRARARPRRPRPRDDREPRLRRPGLHRHDGAQGRRGPAHGPRGRSRRRRGGRRWHRARAPSAAPWPRGPTCWSRARRSTAIRRASPTR